MWQAGSRVTFNENATTPGTGTIVRVWGRRALLVTIRTDDGRTFTRDATRVRGA